MDELNLYSLVAADIQDLVNTGFLFSETQTVPNIEDSSLTFANGEEKKGVVINTCILFVDIRNSVRLNDANRTSTMGRIYTAFVKSVLRVAKYFGGSVRNIIGDRVMIVYPVDRCFQRAIYSAVTINQIASQLIDQKVQNEKFECGIGIHYGKTYVIKVGLPYVKGKEHVENSNLVWIGETANKASRLTDVAGKNGLLPILVSKPVFDGYCKQCPNDNDVIDKRNFWYEVPQSIDNVDFPVYEAGMTWVNPYHLIGDNFE